MPGPIFTPTASPAPARDSTKDSGGEKSSGSQSRLVPEVDVVRRAGSSQTPSIPSRGTVVASEWTTVAFRNGMRFMVAQAAVVSSISTAVTWMSREASAMAVGAEAAAQVRHMLDAGLREALRVPGRDGEPGGLLQARLGEDHLPGELAELGLGLGPQPGLGERGGDQFGGVAGLAERGIEPERLVLPVRSQRRQQLPAFGIQQRGDLVLRCVSHGIKRSSERGDAVTVADRVDGMDDSGTGDSGRTSTAGRTHRPRTSTRRPARRGWPASPGRR